MNVYVESNFVLEHVLEQEQSDSCEALIHLSEARRIKLVIPAFSLAEPHIVLAAREKSRLSIAKQLQGHTAELTRSIRFLELGSHLREVASVLVQSASQEWEGLRTSIARLLRTVEVIALTSEVLMYASALQSTFDRSAFRQAGFRVSGLGLSGQDSIVLASIITHLKANWEGQSCFLSRDKGFEDPDVLRVLHGSKCKFFALFDNALQYVRSQIGG